MTEKRFMIEKDNNLFRIFDGGRLIPIRDGQPICDLLNELNDELEYDEKVQNEALDLIRELRKTIDELSDENEQLKKEVCIKDDLIQQLKIALDTDDYKKHREYRERFIRVCEELSEENQRYCELQKENNQLKAILKANGIKPYSKYGHYEVM